MSAISNIVVASLNFLSLLWSIFVIGGSLFLLVQGYPECIPFFSSPVTELMFGILLFVLSVVAIIGAIRNHKLFLSIYVWSLVGWIVVEICYSTLFLASAATVSTAVREHREYKLNEYPAWLRIYGVYGKKWNSVKECMIEGQQCYKINFHDPEEVQYVKGAPILYGCCQPPPQCGFAYKNGTDWVAPRSGLKSKDLDCKLWSSHSKKMCYDCDACKAGHIVAYKYLWQYNGMFNSLFSVVLAFVLSISCRAYRKAGRDNLESQKIQV